MAVGRRIAALDFRELVVLCQVFAKYPFYLLPTYKATNRTIAISNHLFGPLHHKDNRTNAFRHALWNYLICKYCLSIAGSPDKAMAWSKKITDLHERLSPNNDLAKAMDLHNNNVGRELFLNLFGKEKEFLLVLQEMTKEAVKVASIAQIEEKEKKLVFIENLKTL